MAESDTGKFFVYVVLFLLGLSTFMCQGRKDRMSEASTAQVVVTTVSNDLPTNTIAKTAVHLPDVLVRTVTPLAAIFVRTARVYVQSLLGLLTGGAITGMLPAHDFLTLLRLSAGLALGPAIICALQNAGELLGRIDQKFPSWAPAWLLVGMLGAGAMTGCAANQYHAVVVADQALSQAIFALQDSEIATHKTINPATGKPMISDAKHVEYKATIRRLLVAGDDLTIALQHWQPGTPAPASVAQAAIDVAKLLTDAKGIVPAADPFLAKIQALLDLLQKFGVMQDVELRGGSLEVRTTPRQIRMVRREDRAFNGPVDVAKQYPCRRFATEPLSDHLVRFSGPEGRRVLLRLFHGPILRLEVTRG